MFGSRKKQTAAKVDATDTFIGEGTIIEGKIVTTASLRIEGTVAGDIECAGDVTVGARGNVKSNIAARNIYNAGTIEGSIAAKGKIAISSKGRVFGNISAASLHISEGAVFRGECLMEQHAQAELAQAQEQKRKEGKVKQQASA